MTDKLNQVYSVKWDDECGQLLLLDQTLLPGEVKFLSLSRVEEICQAIYLLQVRGAPVIGVAAAFGLYLGAKTINGVNKNQFMEELKKIAAALNSARPTAVNLAWALNRLVNAAEASKIADPAQLKELLLAEAKAIYTEDEKVCRKIGEYGLTLFKPGMTILTHCNAGQLATVRYGTALAPLYMGQEAGYNFKVYAGETRPLLQGARLTASELTAAGIDTTLICDNMAATLMAQNKINAVLVGCDRVAQNGDMANKIGTLNVAVLANYFKVPFYVCAPISTFDFDCPDGSCIPIEERPGEEVSSFWYQKPMTSPEVKIYNPAFDVTPHDLIKAFITEKGLFFPPFEVTLPKR